MDDRLAQVRVLVDERWCVARAECHENRVRETRVATLEQCLQGDLLLKNATAGVDIVALEREIAVEMAAEEKCRLALAEREKQRTRVERRVWAEQHQIELLKSALKEQRESVDAVWVEMLHDKASLRDFDDAQAEERLQARRKEECLVRDLQLQLSDLEKAIAAKKIDTDKAKGAIENLKHRKRALEGELQTVNAAADSLKTKVAKLRGPNFAAVIEEGVDAILRELDEMGTR